MDLNDEVDNIQAQLEAAIFEQNLSGDEEIPLANNSAITTDTWNIGMPPSPILDSNSPISTNDASMIPIDPSSLGLDLWGECESSTVRRDITDDEITAKYTIGQVDLSDLLEPVDDSNSDSQQEYEKEYKQKLRNRSGIGMQHRKKGARRNDPNSKPELAPLLVKAHELCATRNYDEAIAICKELIRLEPHAEKAYNLYALMCENRGDLEKAFRLYIVAAHLTPKNAEMWRTVTELSRSVGTIRETIYCLHKLMLADPTASDAAWTCYTLHQQNGEVSKAAHCLSHILKYRPHNLVVVRELVNLYDELDYQAEAVSALYEAIIGHAKGEFHSPWAPSTESIELGAEISDGEDTHSIHPLLYKGSTSFDITSPDAGALAYDDLFLLADHCTNAHQYMELLNGVKKGIRVLQGRLAETETWDATDNDDEYNPTVIQTARQLPVEFDDSGAGVPVELRVMLGVARLHLNYTNLAKSHFDLLFGNSGHYQTPEYCDLIDMIADAYIETKLWADALKILDIRIKVPQGNVAAAYTRKAQCYTQLREQNEAINCLNKALELDPEHSTAKEELAILYRLSGQSDLAFAVLSQAEKQVESTEHDQMLFGRRSLVRKRIGQDNVEDDDDDDSDEYQPDEPDSHILLEDQQVKKTQRDWLSERLLRREAMDIKTREVKLKFEKLMLVWARYDELSPSQKLDFIRTAKSLYELFSKTSAFYPGSRKTNFVGLFPSGRLRNTNAMKSAADVGEDEYEHAPKQSILTPRGHYDPDEFERLSISEKRIIRAKAYLNFSFEQWFDVLTWYTVALVKSGHHEQAHEAIRKIADANVYWHDDQRLNQLYLIGLALALYANDINQVMVYCRWFCFEYPYTTDVYRLYAATLSSGAESLLAFAHTNIQKFFRRQFLARFGGTLRSKLSFEEVKRFTSTTREDPNVAITASTPSGYSGSMPSDVKLPIESTSEKVWAAKPVLLTLYGHILSCASSFGPAIAHYSRAYTLCPDDRMINFAMGCVYLHRAMQRKSDNRHLHIVQGFTYLYRYYELSGGDNSQEANYNLARAYHGIGLTYLAHPHYERVLELSQTDAVSDKNSDLHREAAYNLAHIYFTSGSSQLAQQLLQEHCTV